MEFIICRATCGPGQNVPVVCPINQCWSSLLNFCGLEVIKMSSTDSFYISAYYPTIFHYNGNQRSSRIDKCMHRCCIVMWLIVMCVGWECMYTTIHANIISELFTYTHYKYIFLQAKSSMLFRVMKIKNSRELSYCRIEYDFRMWKLKIKLLTNARKYD